MKNNSLINFTVNFEKILENNNSNKILFVSDRFNEDVVTYVNDMSKYLSTKVGKILLINCVGIEGEKLNKLIFNKKELQYSIKASENYDYIKVSSDISFDDILHLNLDTFLQDTQNYDYVFMIVNDLATNDLAYTLNNIFDSVILNISHSNNTITRVKKIIDKFNFLGMKVLGITITKKESFFKRILKRKK